MNGSTELILKDDRRNRQRQCTDEAQEGLHDIQHKAESHPISTNYGPEDGNGDDLEDMSDVAREVYNPFGPQAEFDSRRIRRRWFWILCTSPVPQNLKPIRSSKLQIGIYWFFQSTNWH